MGNDSIPSFEPQLAFQFANQNAKTQSEIINGTVEHSPGELPDGFPGSDDFWNLFKHVVQGRRLLALEYVILVIQRDLEYFLKHTGCREIEMYPIQYTWDLSQL